MIKSSSSGDIFAFASAFSAALMPKVTALSSPETYNVFFPRNPKTVCKINVGTDLRVCWTGKIREYFTLHPEEFEIRKYQGPAREDVREMVRDKMRNVFGSSNHLDK